MDKNESRAQVNTRISAELKADLEEFCSSHGIPQNDAVEMAIKQLLLDKAAAVSSSHTESIKAVQECMQIFLNHYLSALNAADASAAMADERIQMATEETAAQNAKMRAELKELKNRAEQSERLSAAVQRNIDNAIESKKIAEERISFLEEKLEQANTSLEVANTTIANKGKLEEMLEHEREAKTAALERVANLSETYMKSVSEIRSTTDQYQARCLQLEKIITDAGLPLPD